jgi:rare lipoprotein A
MQFTLLSLEVLGSWRARTAAVFLGLGGLVSSGCAPGNEMHPPREPVLATRANGKEPSSGDRDHEIAAQPGTPTPDAQVGLASWYGSELAGKRTASGEVFDPRLFTGAHKQLPFGTWVEVRRLDTGRTVRVRINDRGPNGPAKARLIDLSRRAADDLDLVRTGVTRVEVRIVDGP